MLTKALVEDGDSIKSSVGDDDIRVKSSVADADDRVKVQWQVLMTASKGLLKMLMTGPRSSRITLSILELYSIHNY